MHQPHPHLYYTSSSIYWECMSKHTRPPIIAVVGHIDHGKSRLQRAIRESKIDLFEIGDITQHIGAYELHTTHEGVARRATILDTPGHEAFSHIREHCVELADLVLLVVSAEEGWKTQTGESYAIIKELGIPFIVVFTKIDSSKADLESAKHSLLHNNVYLEGMGGDIPWTAVSSKEKTGIDKLIELIFLVSDVYEITEDKNDDSVGVLVESDINPKIGIAGTVIVLRKKLEKNKYIRVGTSIAPLRIMETDRKVRISVAEPSTPVRVIGFDTVPDIGKPVFLYDKKKDAVADVKKLLANVNRDDTQTSEINLMDAKKIVPIILRSDTVSGLNSISKVLIEAGKKGIGFKIIKKAVGDVSEEDIRLGAQEDACVVLGFHTGIDSKARILSENNGTDLHLFDTIYEIIDWVDSILTTKKDEYQIENITGKATVIRIFEEDTTLGQYVIGAQITEGEFSVDQESIIKRNKTDVGRFKIKKIEQKNKSKDSVTGVKTQFAVEITGTGKPVLKDTLIGLPILKDL